MTREEAEAIIARIASLEIELWRTNHARERMLFRGFSHEDVMAVLSSHISEHAPRWNEAYSSFRVRLEAKALWQVSPHDPWTFANMGAARSSQSWKCAT